MLTFSFKISTLESIPKYAISRSISPGRERALVYDPSPILRTTALSLPPSPHHFIPCMYITAIPILRRNLAPFFPAPCTRNRPPLSCLYSLAHISVRGIKRDGERDKHLGKGRETRIKTGGVTGK